jgi:hypothetical protein
VEQAKQVKYMDLVANTIMLHNVSDLAEVLIDMAADQRIGRSAQPLHARAHPTLRTVCFGHG